MTHNKGVNILLLTGLPNAKTMTFFTPNSIYINFEKTECYLTGTSVVINLDVDMNGQSFSFGCTYITG